MTILKKINEGNRLIVAALLGLAVVVFLAMSIPERKSGTSSENSANPEQNATTSAAPESSAPNTSDNANGAVDAAVGDISNQPTSMSSTPFDALPVIQKNGEGVFSAPAPVQKLPPANIATSAGALARDEQRQSDMRRMLAAQRSWFGSFKRYYTCNTFGGDCRGKTNNFPSSIGTGANDAADPLKSGNVCGRDYVYCGVDNTMNSADYCYYAKLETGGYYLISSQGGFKRSTLPLSLRDCVQAPAAAAPVADVQMTTPQERDAKRQSDMLQLTIAQSKWFMLKGQYYTCGTAGGDCQGKLANYPSNLGFAMAKTSLDPINSGMGCGRDYLYCGLDNSKTSDKFCYYAKLETGGYYTVSYAGSFKRSTPPATFGECGQPN